MEELCVWVICAVTYRKGRIGWTQIMEPCDSTLVYCPIQPIMLINIYRACITSQESAKSGVEIQKFLIMMSAKPCSFLHESTKQGRSVGLLFLLLLFFVLCRSFSIFFCTVSGCDGGLFVRCLPHLCIMNPLSYLQPAS